MKSKSYYHKAFLDTHVETIFLVSNDLINFLGKDSKKLLIQSIFKFYVYKILLLAIELPLEHLR